MVTLTQNLQGQNQEGRASAHFFGFPMLNTGSSDPEEILSMLKTKHFSRSVLSQIYHTLFSPWQEVNYLCLQTE